MADLQHCDAINQDLWDQWVPIHAATPFYDVAAFKAGKNTLKALEREALGAVRGRSLLHLQCHFGLDSLSLAREGALVTAVDYSGAAIRLARQLSAELAIPARFLACNLYDLPAALGEGERFDIIFASYGVLHWLPDLAGWGRVIARLLSQQEGAFFYLAEFHPHFNMLDTDGVRAVFPYFPSGEPVESVKQGACMDPAAAFAHKAYEWPHSLSEILMGLINAGLRIDAFDEYPFMPFNCLPYLEPIGEGRYAPRDRAYPVPLTFSVRASAPLLARSER